MDHAEGAATTKGSLRALLMHHIKISLFLILAAWCNACIQPLSRLYSDVSDVCVASCAPHTLRQSVIVRPMQPRPATSTTFSCQLSSTLMPEPADSFAAPGRPPIWLNPVGWGVVRVGVFGVDPDEDAMPLYL